MHEFLIPIIWGKKQGCTESRSCLSWETSLGEKHPGMSVSSLKKGFQQYISTHKKLILVDESEETQQFIDQQNAHMAP